ncbi:MAG: NAD(P)H-dependent oxidoreductase [Acholeplasmatales bacterium]|nr:NAD(P)H-dependent oxidoreductase [Acholeplasmatales bacterium]
MKSLVVYYSRRGENYAVGNIKEGNAEHIAKVIQKITGADIYEIEPVKEYSKDYMRCTEEAKDELRNQERPEFKNPISSIAEYDTIYLCYPNWWGTFPRVVATFLERYDFSGKTIKPMCTHEGSGMGSSERELTQMLTNATIKSGLAIKGTNAHTSDIQIEYWVKK